MKQRGIAMLCTLLACVAHASDTAAPARTVDIAGDPYRWMEGENNPEFTAWLKAQGARTRTELDTSPIRGQWVERLKNAGNAGRLHRLQRPVAGRTFFLREDNGKEGVLMVRDADGRERALFDPNAKTDANGHASVTEYSVSPDGKLIAVNVDRGGSEITHVQVMDVETGATRKDIAEPVWSEFPVAWLSDGSGFTYVQIAPESEQIAGDLLQNMRVRMHRLGEPADKDAIVLKSGVNPAIPFDPRELPRVDASAPSDWAIGQLLGALPEQRLCLVKKTDAFRPSAAWKCIADYSDGVQAAELHDSTLYLLSVKGAPNGRVLALDLSKGEPKLSNARTVLPDSTDFVITGIISARDALYVRRMKNGLDSMARVPHGSTQMQAITMPFDGAAYLMSADPRADGVVFTLQGWTQPRRALRFDPASGKVADLNLGATAPAKYDEIQAIETEATSADGTRVPLSIIMRKDVAHDGRTPAILDGYGGYGISQQPYFDPLALEWVRAGRIYAVAHVRGGGEKGNAWRLGGKGALKYKGVEDFIGCARELVRLKLTNPEHTAAIGASAGGILIGGAITRAPEQFGVAVITAGILNPVRILAGKNGANQIEELADPATESGLKILTDMDPYQHVRDGVSYPALLLMVGLNDNRVVPWHSGKFGARIAAASRSGKPVRFRTDEDTGHFGTALSARAAQRADIHTFIEMQMK